MAKAKEKFIAFVVEDNVALSEYLRYACVISVEGRGHSASIPYSIAAEVRKHIAHMDTAARGNKTYIAVVIECPKGLDREIWIKHNRDRLSSFSVSSWSW